MNATLSRLDRILAMVPWLLAHPEARMSEVAERFGTTPEAIAADLDILGYCGVPGYGGGDLIEVSVIGDQVHVRMADYFRRPLKLGLREAMTLLLAGRALLEAPALADTDALRRAVSRLEAALGVAHVTVDLSAQQDEPLEQLRRAVTDRRVVHLRYRGTGSEQESERAVEPWALVAAQGFWYLRGHCRAAGGVRDFRLDRIRSVTSLPEQAPAPPEDARIERPSYIPGEGDIDVVMSLEEHAAWMGDAIPGATVTEDGRVRFRARSLEWAARLVLSLGGKATVAGPPELVSRIKYLASGARGLYGRN